MELKTIGGNRLIRKNQGRRRYTTHRVADVELGEDVARQERYRWAKCIIQWRSKANKRSVGILQKRWINDIMEKVGKSWHQLPLRRVRWKKYGQPYVQE